MVVSQKQNTRILWIPYHGEVMSYIRCSTLMRKRKGDPTFEKVSNTYAYHDGQYVNISNGWKRLLNQYIRVHGKKEGTKIYNDLPVEIRTAHQVSLTDAEMRYMCRSYLSRLGELKKRTGGSYDPQPRKGKSKPHVGWTDKGI